MYELIGRMVVSFIRWRYGRQIKLAAGAGLLLAGFGVAAYLASRGDEEEPV